MKKLKKLDGGGDLHPGQLSKSDIEKRLALQKNIQQINSLPENRGKKYNWYERNIKNPLENKGVNTDAIEFGIEGAMGIEGAVGLSKSAISLGKSAIRGLTKSGMKNIPKTSSNILSEPKVISKGLENPTGIKMDNLGYQSPAKGGLAPTLKEYPADSKAQKVWESFFKDGNNAGPLPIKKENGGNMTKKQANNSSLILDYGKHGVNIKSKKGKKAYSGIDIAGMFPKQPLDEEPDFSLPSQNKRSFSLPQAPQSVADNNGVMPITQDMLKKPKSKSDFDLAKTTALGLTMLDAIMPGEQGKLNQAKPEHTGYYNPHPSGTGSSALMEDGGFIPMVMGDSTLKRMPMDTTGFSNWSKEERQNWYAQRDMQAINSGKKGLTKQGIDSLASKFNRQNWVETVNATGYEPIISKKSTAKNLEMGGGLPGASGMFYARSNNPFQGSDYQPKSMRMGGHFRPEEDYEFGGKMSSYEQGGELQLYSPDSEAEHLSDSIVKFGGAEHGEKNAIGSEGIPLEYGGHPVEVENDETGYSTQDGGFTVLGKMQNPLTGRMFKNDGKELAKKEMKASKQMIRGNSLMENADTQDPFELLKFNSGKAKTIGAKAKSDIVQKEKETLASLQQHMLNFAEQNNLDPNAMSKGKIKTAKYGISIPKAKNGITADPTLPDFVGKPVRAARTGYEDFTKPSFTQAEHDVYKAGKSLGDIIAGKYNSTPQPTGVEFDGDAARIGKPSISDDIMFKGADWKNYMKPGYVLATNKVEPVRAQMYNPRLEQTYQSEVDLNPIIANNRATQLSLSGNAAEAATAGAIVNQQLYSAQGQGFAQNQERTTGAYNRNNATVNDAQLKNLGIADQQYTRQEQAKSNTRRMTTDAIGQIADIDLQNKRDWNNFNVQKQLFPTYGVDPNNQLKVVNPYEFNSGVPSGAVYKDGTGKYYDKDRNTLTTTKDGVGRVTKQVEKKVGAKYGVSIAREFKSYKP